MRPVLRAQANRMPSQAGGDRLAGVRALALEIPRDPVRVSLFLFIFISISRVHQLFGFIGALRPALVLFAAAAGFAVMKPHLVAFRRLTASWAPKVLLAFGVLVNVSAVFGISLGGSATFLISDFSKTFISTLLLIAAIRSVADLRFFMWAYVLSMGLWVYTGFTRFDLSSRGSAAARLGYTGMQFDANDLGLLMAMGLPIALILFSTSRRTGKVVSGLIMVGTAMLVARTGSRGAFLGIACVGVAVLLLARDVSVAKRLAFVVVSAVALALSAPPGYWDQMRTMLNPTEDYNYTGEYGRMEIFKRGMGYVAQYPVFGLGPNQFGRAEGTISELARAYTGDGRLMWTAPHNTYLQVVAETGLVGFTVWIYLFLRGFSDTLRLRKRIPRHWARGSPEERFLYTTAIYMPSVFVGFAIPAAFVSFAYLAPYYLLVAYLTGYASLVAERVGAPVRGRRRMPRLVQPAPVR